MSDTRRTLSQLQALLADNNVGAISPQDLRDFLVSTVITAVTSKTADYPIVEGDSVVNVTANSPTITLPTAVDAGGVSYTIKNSGGGIVTVATTSAQTIDGAASGSLTLSRWDSLTVVSDGANWIVI